MKTQTPEEKKQVEEAIANPAALNELIEALSGGSRRGRQQAAKVIAAVAAANSEILVPHAAALVDALERPEAQTRWECLDTLAQIVTLYWSTC